MVAIYTHPEYYPPLLNTIDSLADQFRSVIIQSRNLKESRWNYPSNTRLVTSGSLLDIRVSESKPVWWKIKSFLRYSKDFLTVLNKEQPDWVMCNDAISLFSFKMIRPLLKFRPKLWYHNHDVVELKTLRPYSVGYFAVKSELKYFNQIDLFTLPSEERLKYFPVNELKGRSFVVPNYPSLKRMQVTRTEWVPGSKIKLLYQGRVSNEHGLEEMIEYVKSDPDTSLTIVGPGNETYVTALRNRIDLAGVTSRVSMMAPVPYVDLRKITLEHHVGLAINKPMNILYQTAAMASNKIYEYASAGLPILYFNDPHYNKVLGEYGWAFPTDLSNEGLMAIMRNIRANFNELSRHAQESFRNGLNFETGFKPVISFLMEANEN